MSDVGPVQKFFGAALMAVGGLVAALCGLCTLAVIGFGSIDALASGSNRADLVSAILVAGLIGGVPAGLGVLLFIWGRRLFAPARPVQAGRLAAFSDDPEEKR